MFAKSVDNLFFARYNMVKAFKKEELMVSKLEINILDILEKNKLEVLDGWEFRKIKRKLYDCIDFEKKELKNALILLEDKKFIHVKILKTKSTAIGLYRISQLGTEQLIKHNSKIKEA